jgi:glycosyltransferase involved in cell wall biosynthesis
MSDAISFIVPAYNCEATIVETLESIYKDNYCDGDEVIVVNDCSSDHTENVLQHYASHRKELKIISHSRNKGGSAARNTAVENARHELIFCLDSDNILQSRSIAKLRQYLISQNADAAAFQELRYFKDRPAAITHKWIFRAGVVSLSDCLASDIVPISSGNYLFTKRSWKTAGGYPEFARALDAWGFGLRQLAEGHKMVVLEGTGYFHRYGHESYWVRESKQGKTSITALQILLPYVHLLSPRSAAYIMSRKGRDSWFDNIGNRPLRVRTGPIGSGGVVVDAEGDTRHRELCLVKYLKWSKAFLRRVLSDA